MKKICDITGVILAGGCSERFGSNKAFVSYLGTSFIQRIYEVMDSVFEELVIVTNTPDDYRSFSIPILKDIQPYKGPMGGIITALHASLKDKIFVVACDMPLLNAKVIREVIEKGKGFDAAVPVYKGVREYLMAIYSRKLLPKMTLSLSEGKLSLRDLCRTVEKIIWIPITENHGLNVNTRKDLKLLENHDAL